MNHKGFLKIKILEFTSEYFQKKNFYITLSSHGNHHFKINSNHFNSQKQILYPKTDAIQFQIDQNYNQNHKQGYFNLSILKLYNYTHQKHKININCVWRNKHDQTIIQGNSGIIRIQLVYLQEITAKLEFNVNKIVLDEQLKPNQSILDQIYVEIRTDEVCLRTTEKVNENNQIDWNENLTFILENLPSQFLIDFKVQNVLKNDPESKEVVQDKVIVKNVKVNPHQQDYFFPTDINVARQYQFYDQNDQKFGKLQIKTKFTLIVLQEKNMKK